MLGIRSYAEKIVDTEDLLAALVLAGLAAGILTFLIGLFNRRNRRKWLLASLSGFAVAITSFFLFPLPEKPPAPSPAPAAAYKAPTEARYQIEQRQMIFRELVKAEDRAQIEALKKYPLDSFKLSQYRDKLKESYKEQVRNRYDITKEEAGRIYNEGENRNWPKPGAR